MEQLIFILTLAAATAVLVVSLNLAFGYAGIANLAHVATAGVGAYAFAIAQRQFAAPFPVAVAAGVAAAVLLAALCARLLGRIRGDALALVTLFLTFVISVVLVTWRDLFGVGPISALLPQAWHNLTRGTLGLPGIRRPAPLASSGALLAAASLTLVVVWGIVARLTRSPFGRLLGAVRDDELAAQALGKDTAVAKAKVLVLSSALAALGGILFALLLRYLDPTTFHLNDLILVLTALAIGGLGSTSGPLVGTAVVFAVVELLRFVPAAVLPPSSLGPLRQIIYAVVLLVLLRVRPHGLAGRVALT